jgi:dihydrofolate reductase
MPRTIVVQFVSLDGVTDDPDGSAGTPSGGWAWRYGPGPVSGDKFRMGPVLDTGVMLVGRTTWELLGGIFPGQDDDFSLKLNAMDKLVATHTLTDVSRWANSAPLRGDLAEAAAERRRHQVVMVVGSGSVVEQLVARDLVDEYRLMVFPIVLGTGRRLFDGAAEPRPLRLVGTVDVGSGVLLHTYEREGR